METIFDRFGILFIAFVVLILRLVFRSAAATSGKADASETTGAPAKSVAETDVQVGKTHTRMTMQKQISARKAELQAKREQRQAAQTILSLEGLSLEGQSLEGTSLESLSLEGSTKRRQQAPVQQPERTAEPSGSECNEWMEGFDIRRAVVWSEILRPKFKEDEEPDGIVPY